MENGTPEAACTEAHGLRRGLKFVVAREPRERGGLPQRALVRPAVRKDDHRPGAAPALDFELSFELEES
jgi:hypothetical protein